MTDSPSKSLPPKRDVARALLDKTSMFIHLDPRRSGVCVPRHLVSQPQLILQVGRGVAIPIPDLEVSEAGITGTLSFDRLPFWCRIPWPAVYALVGENESGSVWPEEVPPEVQLPSARPGADPSPDLPAGGSAQPEAPSVLRCSFCGKPQQEVKKLIAGPSVYICDECIGLCNDIIAEEVEKEEREDP